MAADRDNQLILSAPLSYLERPSSQDGKCTITLRRSDSIVRPQMAKLSLLKEYMLQRIKPTAIETV